MQNTGVQPTEWSEPQPAAPMISSESPIVRVHVGHGYVVRATLDRFTVSRSLPLAMAPTEAITQPDLLRQVFAGAFHAASRHLDATAHGVERAASPSLMSYVYGLLAAYQTTHATSPLMTALAARYACWGRQAVAERCLVVASEESGHDTLALRDLDALGYPAAALANAIRPRRAQTMVNLLFRFVAADDPVACFGYLYALDRSAVFAGETELRRLESLVPPGIRATRRFRFHSALGADAAHLRDALDFMVTLRAAEQVRIAQGIFETLCVMHDPDLDDYPGDDAMAARIAAIVQETRKDDPQ